eukprot:CAMPEP_0172572444 /NCGR_PEP_ID=MMETSP1067-20121228/135134_1 /TAXON_ID=265564 ORGANISM="Thalassiosira punctigera, Strain Tpunct2005C2" /NCGR_SAMPLE_ID=MMETSP1067 /ASSEMBLY_ACC=CAM_ASM_000444 /LENGTH=41 /DNA_ID= /DNA_START= /DNA_END= /DNA_ORIENTATION=
MTRSREALSPSRSSPLAIQRTPPPMIDVLPGTIPSSSIRLP